MPDETAVLSRLDKIITLLAASVAADKPQLERIRRLSSAGLAPLEIAQALGTTANTVRVALVGLRKSGRVRRGRKPKRTPGGTVANSTEPMREQGVEP